MTTDAQDDHQEPCAPAFYEQLHLGGPGPTFAVVAFDPEQGEIWYRVAEASPTHLRAAAEFQTLLSKRHYMLAQWLSRVAEFKDSEGTVAEGTPDA